MRASSTFCGRGALGCYYQNSKLLLYEDGDLVGLEQLFADTSLVVSSDFAVVVDEYQASEFFKALSARPELYELWNRLVGCRLTLLSVLVGAFTKKEAQVDPHIMHFGPGERIINQGDEAREVFTLIDGHAEVFVDNVKVGDVLPDEIFGALAALTRTPRTASVIATENCMVVSIPGDHFIDLITGRPSTVLQLVKDMARTIVSLNERVVDLYSRKG